MLVFLLLTLLTFEVSTAGNMKCDEGGVTCIKSPEWCTSSADCYWMLKYQSAGEDTTKIEISGIPEKVGLGSTADNMWIAYGFSPRNYGMRDLMIYACQRVNGSDYTVRKMPGYEWGVDNDASEKIEKEGTLKAKFEDGVMTCAYEIMNSDLPSEKQRMVFDSAGPMTGFNNMGQHYRTPQRTEYELSFYKIEDKSGIIKYPAWCNSSDTCYWMLKFQPAGHDSTKIEISGIAERLGLSSTSDNMWLAYGFSPRCEGMRDLTVYACQRVNGDTYNVRKIPSYSYGDWGIDNDASTEVSKPASLTGSFEDGVMKCSYVIHNSNLPQERMKLIFDSSGPMGGFNLMKKHYRTPQRTKHNFSFFMSVQENEDISYQQAL